VSGADRIARRYSGFFPAGSGFAPSSGASCVVGFGDINPFVALLSGG